MSRCGAPIFYINKGRGSGRGKAVGFSFESRLADWAKNERFARTIRKKWLSQGDPFEAIFGAILGSIFGTILEPRRGDGKRFLAMDVFMTTRSSIFYIDKGRVSGRGKARDFRGAEGWRMTGSAF